VRARSPKVQQLTEGALARAEAPSAITEDESVWQSQTRVRSDAQTLPPTIPSIPPDPIFGGPAIDDAFDDAWESR
jgi:hypothetical protein